MMQRILLYKEGNLTSTKKKKKKNGMFKYSNYLFRKLLIDRLQREPEIKVLLLESVCTDKAVRRIFFICCLLENLLTYLFRFWNVTLG